jgi:hypothetical protein
MYTQILDVALRERPPRQPEKAPGEALSTLLERRRHLDAVASSERGTDWAPAALANQVAYDVALIELAQCVGLDCEPGSFDQPHLRRAEIERQLMSRGLRLDEPDQPVNSTSVHR